jgi:hypothetical protein
MVRGMSHRRLISVLSAVVVASGSLVVAAAPKKDDKTPVAPAKDEPAADPAAAGSGSAVDMPEDAPPSDMNGTDENPDAPHDISKPAVTAVAPAPTRPSGYPTEEALRPITLPANMSEVALSPHLTASPYNDSELLHARYGITSRIQLGLSYVLGGTYKDPSTAAMKLGFHPGKAVGVDVTVLLQNWIAIRVGVPVYIDPVAVGLQLGAPLKFTFGQKFALGGMDDLLDIKISKFAPTFNSEYENAVYAASQDSNTEIPNGHLRFSAYGIYQYTTKTAIVARAGVDTLLTSGSGGGAGATSSSSTATFLRAGVDWTPRRFLDLGVSVGFDDLAHGGSFSPAGYLALRI